MKSRLCCGFRLVPALQVRSHPTKLNLSPLRGRLSGPFTPFAICLSDGRKFAVPPHDFIAVGKGVVSIVDERDSTHTVDALHSVNISDPPPKWAKSVK